MQPLNKTDKAPAFYRDYAFVGNGANKQDANKCKNIFQIE